VRRPKFSQTVRGHPTFAGAVAGLGIFVLMLPSCGVMSSNDCLERAACPTPDATSVPDQTAGDREGADVTIDEPDEADAPGEAGPDAEPADAGGDGADVVGPDAPVDEAEGQDGADGTVDAPAEVGPACDVTSPDCSSVGCGGRFQCAPVAPSGWLGPVSLFDQTGSGKPAPSAPACSGGPYPSDVYDGHANPVYGGGCTCVCGAASASCSGPTVNVFQDSQCGTSCITVANVSTCARACSSSSALSAVVTTAPAPSGGSCPPSVQNGIQPWSETTDWATTARLCAPTRALTQGGCAAGQVCADAPAAGFVQALCVYQLGQLACPTGFPHQYLYYGHGTDFRTCTSSCGCASPTGVTCTLEGVSVSASSSCSSAAGLSTTIGQCSSNLAATARFVTASVTPSGGQCATAGTASVVGTVTPNTPTTVCCTM
jgi:hypothetical protein